MLLCTVRDCHAPLERTGRTYTCPRGHSFDVARSGYVNLLQPQDRRSKRPGDSPQAVAARRRLHDRGIFVELLQAIADQAAVSAEDVVLDAGCGEGSYLGTLQAKTGCEAHGIDISSTAIDAASRRYPHCQWIVANADLEIPFSSASFSLVLSITARMNVAEFRRVLRDDGRLLVAIPAAEDLIELRGAGRDRVTRTMDIFAPGFQLLHRSAAKTTAHLDREAVEDILLAIYRPWRREPPSAMAVTFALDLLLFAPNL